MPHAYFCHACNLYFDLGGFHFSSPDPYAPTPIPKWWRADLYVCVDCGTQYSINESLPDGSDEGKRHSVEVQAEPLNGKQRDGSSFFHPINMSEWKPYVFPGESSVNWDDIAHDQLEKCLEMLICNYCGNRGRLTIDHRALSVCPRCKTDNLKSAGLWMT